MAPKVELKSENGNRVWKIIETLVIAFIIGGITMWGSSQRMDERLKGIESTLSRLELTITSTSSSLVQHLIETGKDKR